MVSNDSVVETGQETGGQVVGERLQNETSWKLHNQVNNPLSIISLLKRSEI